MLQLACVHGEFWRILVTLGWIVQLDVICPCLCYCVERDVSNVKFLDWILRRSADICMYKHDQFMLDIKSSNQRWFILYSIIYCCYHGRQCSNLSVVHSMKKRKKKVGGFTWVAWSLSYLYFKKNCWSHIVKSIQAYGGSKVLFS